MHTLARIIALTDREDLKTIQVVNKTLTATNGHMMVRSYVDLPDGYYYPSNGQLIPMPRVQWFPDLGPQEERVNRATVMGEWSVEDRFHFIQVCHEAKANGDKVTVDPSGVWIDRKLALNNTLYDDEGNYLGEEETRVGGYAFNTGLTATMKFPPDQLVIAINELAKYDTIKVLIDHTVENSPLILGLNWGSCVVIMPYALRWGRMQDDLSRSA